MNNDKICSIVGCFPQTSIDSALLSLTLESIKKQSYKTCLVSHSPVNLDIQKSVNYFLYTDENHLLSNDTTSFYIYSEYDNLYYQSSNFPAIHGFAVLMNIKNAVNFLKTKKFTHFIYFEPDSFLNHNDHLKLKQMLEECDFMNKDFWFMNENYDSNKLFPVTSIFAGKVDFFVELLNGIDTIQDFIDVAAPTNVLEWFFKNKIESLSSGFIQQINPRNCFTSEWLGVSSSGNVKIPGIQTNIFSLDVVRNFNTDDEVIFTFKNDSHGHFKLIGYINDNLVFSEIVNDDFFRWYLHKVKHSDTIKYECFDKNNQLLKQVFYQASQILSNNLSYIRFK